MQMHSIAGKPRLLADDLQILCTGANRLKLYEARFTKTQAHLQDMGATLAPSKSMTFSTDAATRGWMEEDTQSHCRCDRFQGSGSTPECDRRKMVWYDRDKQDATGGRRDGKAEQDKSTVCEEGSTA